MGSFGGLGELLCAREAQLMPLPPGVDREVAACLLQAGIVALLGLRRAGVKPRERVLINGAGGSAGSYAVQLAKETGATVTAVDRSEKEAYLRGLGADDFIDFQARDFAQGSERYDVVLDLVASRGLLAVSRCLAPGGRYVLAGGRMRPLLAVLLWGPLLGRLQGKAYRLLAAEGKPEDYEELLRRSRAGRLVTQIDRRYPLARGAEALRYLGDGHACGKLLVLPG